MCNSCLFQPRSGVVSDAVTSHQASWPGRPSPQTAGSVLLLSAANGLTQIRRRWTADVWALGLAAVALTPFVAIAAYMFDAVSLTRITPSTGMGNLHRPVSGAAGDGRRFGSPGP